jgi:hypothetical protein
MARKKGNPPASQSAAATSQPNGTKSITKQEAVRRVMVEFGLDVSPKDIVKHVKEKFGLDMTIDHVYVARGVAKRELTGKKGKKKAGRGRKAPTVATTIASKAKAGTGNGATKISLEDIHTLQELTHRIGAQPLKELIAMLAK